MLSAGCRWAGLCGKAAYSFDPALFSPRFEYEIVTEEENSKVSRTLAKGGIMKHDRGAGSLLT